VLHMAVPRLAEELPFYRLDPEHLSMPRGRQPPRKGRPRLGARSPPPSCHRWTWSSAAASREPPGRSRRQGRRILRPRGCLPGRGGVLRPDPVLATTVHPLQVVDEPSRNPPRLPCGPHRHRGRGQLVHRAAAAIRHPLGAPGPRQDRPSSSVGGPGSSALRHQGNQLKGSPVVTTFSSLLKAALGRRDHRRAPGTGLIVHCGRVRHARSTCPSVAPRTYCRRHAGQPGAGAAPPRRLEPRRRRSGACPCHPGGGDRDARGVDRGLEAARRWVEKQTQPHAVMHIVSDQLVEAGDRVVVFARRQMRWRETGELADETPQAALLTFHVGRLSRWQLFPDRKQALLAAGLESGDPAPPTGSHEMAGSTGR
jgi:hypothetical protein